MSNNLVERLRESADKGREPTMCRGAADEIERLRAQLAWVLDQLETIRKLM